MKKYIRLISGNYKKDIVLFVILNLLLVFAETVSLGLIPLFIDYAFNPSPIILEHINLEYNFFSFLNSDKPIYLVIYFLLAVFLIKNLFTLSVVSYQALLQKKFNVYLKQRLLNLYLKSPFIRIKSYNSSEIFRNIETEAPNYVSNFFEILKFSKDILLFISIFFLLLMVDLKSTIVALFFLVLVVIIYFFSFYKFLNKMGINLLNSKMYLIQWTLQSLAAIKEIKISKKEDKALEKFVKFENIFENAKKNKHIIQALPNSLFELLFATITLLIIAHFLTNDIKNILPVLSLYVVAFIRLLPIFSRFGSTLTSLRASSESANILNNEISKLENESLNNQSFPKSEYHHKNFTQNIKLENLEFSYPGNTVKTINNLSVKIMKGQIIAFVGKSGSGKTTLINLICGLLKPSAGKIKIDDIDTKEIMLSWQSKIGLISQENYLLDDSLLNNITFIEDDKKIDKTRLDNAIRYSGLENLIKNLDDGINTKVGERGAFLSGGQIQRIALARTLYRNTDVLVLDEFTNSLDPNLEDQILEQLKLLIKNTNKTLIIISHKLKPLKICDQILLLDQGNIREILSYKDFYDKYNLLYD